MISKEHIVYQDENLVAINKPNGLLVHRTEISEEKEVFAIQLLRDLLGQKVYNIHRIDRPTSGVLLFALNNEMSSIMSKYFKDKEIKKTYVALVRGWFPEFAILNHPIRNGDGIFQSAETSFRLLEKYELSIPVDPYETSRYSMIEAMPRTGRWHQIRQHLAHMRHYIINDRVHGTGHHNRMFTEQLGIYDLFLHAWRLEFEHPLTGRQITIEAGFPPHWDQFKKILEAYALPVN